MMVEPSIILQPTLAMTNNEEMVRRDVQRSADRIPCTRHRSTCKESGPRSAARHGEPGSTRLLRGRRNRAAIVRDEALVVGRGVDTAASVGDDADVDAVS